MFGQDDNNNNQNSDINSIPTATANGPSFIVGQPATADPASQAPVSAVPMPAQNNPAVVQPTVATPQPDQNKDVISPAGGFPSSPNTRISTDDPSFPDPSFNFSSDPNPVPDPDPAPPAPQTSSVADLPDQISDEDLIGIKKKALSELIPIIDSLDQPPLDKFRTIMMMIQASDDERLIEKAYESAHSIDDAHAKAQALLDLVNEINYFTQAENKTSQPETTPAITSPLNI